MPPKRQNGMKPRVRKLTLDKLLSNSLREWKISKSRQNFPHRPKTFPASFPAKATEQKLCEEVWWWRYADEDNAKRIFPPWGDESGSVTQMLLQVFLNYMEPSAWFYEFRARYRGRYKWDFGAPWIRCSDEQRRLLANLVPPEHPSKFFLPVSRREDFWIVIPDKVNLLVNDATLVRSFLATVRKERHVRGLSAPGKTGGVRRKRRTWVPIEAMDLEHYEIRLQTDAERGQVSKWYAFYEATCERLKLAP
jgi:hypothetical protein